MVIFLVIIPEQTYKAKPCPSQAKYLDMSKHKFDNYNNKINVKLNDCLNLQYYKMSDNYEDKNNHLLNKIKKKGVF